MFDSVSFQIHYQFDISTILLKLNIEADEKKALAGLNQADCLSKKIQQREDEVSSFEFALLVENPVDVAEATPGKNEVVNRAEDLNSADDLHLRQPNILLVLFANRRKVNL